MKHTDSEVVAASRRRIAKVFGLPVERVLPELVFGKDLVGSGKTDFRYSELDQVLHDIRDVADRQTMKELNSGTLEIKTVDDYCNHMLRCIRANENAVVSTLRLQPHQANG